MRPENLFRQQDITRVTEGSPRQIPTNTPVLVSFGNHPRVIAYDAPNPAPQFRSLLVFPDTTARGRRGQVFHTQADEQVSIGSSPTRDLLIESDFISPNHARLQRASTGAWSLEDTSSLNGTYMDRILAIPPTDEMHLVPPGQWVFLPTPNAHRFVASIQLGAEREESAQPMHLSRINDETAALRIGDTEHQFGLNIPIHIGSGSENSIQIAGAEEEHATLIALHNGYLVRDRSSSGTLVRVSDIAQNALLDLPPGEVNLFIAEQKMREEASEHAPTRFVETASITVESPADSRREDVTLRGEKYLAVFNGAKDPRGERSAAAIAAGKLWEVLDELGDNPEIAEIKQSVTRGLEQVKESLHTGMATSASIVYLTRVDGRQFAVIIHSGTTKARVVKENGRIIPLTVDQGKAYADAKEMAQAELRNERKSSGEIEAEAQEASRYMMEQFDRVDTLHLANSMGDDWLERADASVAISETEAIPVVSVYEVASDDVYIVCSTPGIETLQQQEISDYMLGVPQLTGAVDFTVRAATMKEGIRHLDMHTSLVAGKLH